jgi:hypothetical protein
MMPRVHVFKVGPLEHGKSIYVPIGEEADLDPTEAEDDVSGLLQIVQQAPDVTLAWSIELADAARSLGQVVEELPAIYEGSRIWLAMKFAQDGDLHGITDVWSELRLMSGLTDFLERRVLARWPERLSFEVELRGDRSQLLGGWLEPGSAPAVTLVASPDDAKRLALSTSAEREEWRASHDYLSMTLESPPPYALEPLKAFWGIDVMPRFAKRQEGQRARANDEDALVMAGVLATLAQVDDLRETTWSETRTPERVVRTFVQPGLPFPFVDLP